ncbi:MAG: DUF1508 domain-containing protein [Leptospiraceae bacterium]|nr:DUF1508 domain-containing protein [Leptospiraceae bacterium]MCP5495941.1 DUF1508 domain-containing protein [Leptospiraceae bacterium]
MAAKAKFEVYKDKSGEFKFKLKSKNGDLFHSEQSYKTKAGCMKGIDSLRKNVTEAVVAETE